MNDNFFEKLNDKKVAILESLYPCNIYEGHEQALGMVMRCINTRFII